MSSPAASLPVDLLAVILEYVTVVDFIRFGAVCRSWRSAVSRFRSTKGDDLRRLKPQFPWLMLSVDGNPQSKYFYCFSECKLFHFHLPQIANHHVIGFSSGFLITVDNATADLHALNPLTGAQISPPTLPGAQIVSYYQKVIVSPSTHAMVVICDLKRQLLFARPGDGSWTALVRRQGADSYIVDVVFHKGKLCAINGAGKLMAFDLDYPLNPPVVLNDSYGMPFGLSDKYLVESPYGDDLFMLIRYYTMAAKVTTVRFDVFMLKTDDDGKSKLKEIDNVGELMLFVGFNGSLALALSSCDLSYARSNLIFFTEHYSTHIILALSTGKFPNVLPDDCGVFDLGNRTIQPLNICCGLPKIHPPPAMWFSPILS